MNNKPSQNINTHKTFVHSLFISLVIVMTLSHLAGTVVSLIDTFCISKYLGNNGLTAVGLFAPIIQILGAISQVFAIGGQLVFTKLLAKGDNKNAKKHLTSNTYFLFILGALLAVTLFFISIPVANALSAGKSSKEVTELTSQYLKGFVIGIPFLFLYEYLSSIVYIDNDKTRTTLSIVVLFATNIALDFLFATFFKNKAFGIGIASAIAYIFASLALITHFISKKSNFKLTGKYFKFNYIKDSFISGIPVGVKNIVITARIYLLNFLMLTIGGMAAKEGITGDLVVAAHGIEANVSNIFDIGLAGLIQTVLMLGGAFYSEEDEKCLNELLMDVTKFAIIVGLSLSIIYFFTAPYIATLYTKDQQVIYQATYAMRANSISLIFMTFATSFLAFFQATKRSVLANISTTLQSFVLPITFVCILGFTIGIKGIWIGIPLGFMVYVLIHVVISFIINKRIRFDVRTLFFLPKDFGYKEDEIYERDIASLTDVYLLQKEVYDFCEKLNIDNKRKQNLSNAAEELGALIVLSGFTRKIKEKHKPHASIRVLYKKNTNALLIRTRDNCEKFDIKEKIKELKEGTNKDIALNCSLKILLNISKDIEYSQLFKTNNMIIKF